MSAENWLFSVGSMLSTCNKVVQYSWKSSSKLQKTDNDIHNNLSDCGFAVWQFSASALQSTVIPRAYEGRTSLKLSLIMRPFNDIPGQIAFRFC